MIKDTLEKLFIHDGVIKMMQFTKLDETQWKWLGYPIAFIARLFIIVVIDGSLIALSKNGINNLDTYISTDTQSILSILALCIGNFGAIASAMGSVWSEGEARKEREQEREKAEQEREKAEQRHEELLSTVRGLDLVSTSDINKAVKNHNARLRREIVVDIANNILQLDVSKRYDMVEVVEPRDLMQRPYSNETQT